MTAVPRRTLLTSAIAAAVGAAFAPRRAQAMPGGPLRIGVLADLTGPLAAHGHHQLLGVRHRAEAITGSHGHAGEEITLLVADTAADVDTARAAAFGLLEQGVHALIGSSAGWTTPPSALPNGPTMRRFSESFAAANGPAAATPATVPTPSACCTWPTSGTGTARRPGTRWSGCVASASAASST